MRHEDIILFFKPTEIYAACFSLFTLIKLDQMLHPSRCGRLLAFVLIALASWRSTAFAKNEETWEEVPVNCDDPRSFWEEHVCEVKNKAVLQLQCHPRYILSGKRRPKGLIVGFHGYTACPDSFESMIEAWVLAGYDVMMPLLVGNGRKPGECADMTSAVFSDFTVCVDGNRIDSLPLSRQGYMDFVATINAIVKEEKETRKYRKVFVSGLSHGGPLGSYATSSGGGLYDGNIAMNSFFGFSSPATDRVFNTCVEDALSVQDCASLLTGQITDNFDVGLAPEGFVQFVDDTIRENLPNDYSYEDYAVVNAVIRRIMTELAENYDSLEEGDLKILINEATLSWGPKCTEENDNGRGGICAFRLRNLFAAHSFAMYAHRLTGSYYSARARVQFVTTERDGSTRNSLIVQAAQNEIRANAENISFVCIESFPVATWKAPEMSVVFHTLCCPGPNKSLRCPLSCIGKMISRVILPVVSKLDFAWEQLPIHFPCLQCAMIASS